MEKQSIVMDCGNCEYNDGTGHCSPANCHKIPGMSTHRFNVILRGICNGAALRNKQPEILTDTQEIVCTPALDIWDICAISSDAEAFGLKAEFHYDGKSRIVFTPTPQKKKSTSSSNIPSEAVVLNIPTSVAITQRRNLQSTEDRKL